MISASHCGERNTVPTATDRSMNMSEKEMFDVGKIECLIDDRNEARKNKDWGRADECRDELTEMGVVLEDTAQGTEWKIK